MITQITEEEWFNVANKRFHCFHMCSFPFSVSEIEEKFGLTFFEYEEDGLGTHYGCYISIEDKMFYILGLLSKNFKDYGVTVVIKEFEVDKLNFLECICSEFGIGGADLLWLNTDLCHD